MALESREPTPGQPTRPRSTRPAPPRPTRRQAASQRGDRSRRWAGIFLVLALVLSIALVVQHSRNARLEGQIDALSAELRAAQRETGAYRQHLSRVRERVGDIESRVSELGELVARDPAAAARETPRR